MRVGEALGNFRTELGGLGVGQADIAVEQVAERAPTEILEDQIRSVGVVTPVEDAAGRGGG